MKNLNFKQWLEATDIFGFYDQKKVETNPINSYPLNAFDTEMMVEFLTMKNIGLHKPQLKFMNEIQWGELSGAVKLGIEPGYSLHARKLGNDLNGNKIWYTKKVWQINRRGYGGYEDQVANEIYEQITSILKKDIDTPIREYEDLENLVIHVANKLKRHAKEIFDFQGIKKIEENSYIISLQVAGAGTEAPGHSRIEQNQTSVSYDKDTGLIRMINYNIESPVGGSHEWKIMPSDFDEYFFPTQDRDEISEPLVVHMKYY